ncbi:MAG: hypothetical protein KDI88_09645 [Gammaproteobacteria bacterium]|nr:hypothetical protein [Gammaproteobacteria bacterium]
MMNAMTNAEKQKAYRDRVAAKKIADAVFDGDMSLTVERFLEGVGFDEQVFWDALEYRGEVTEEYQEEVDRVWQEAFDEAYRNAYDAELADAQRAGFDADNDDDETIRDAADEFANQAADEAVKEWESTVRDYDSTCVEYQLVDLIAAYKEAHRLL